MQLGKQRLRLLQLCLGAGILLGALQGSLPSCAGQDPPSAKGPRDVGQWHLLEPFWNSPVIHGESVLFLRDDDQTLPSAPLLMKPMKILRVTSADRTRTFEEGRDYVVEPDGGWLRLPAGSRIPFLRGEDLYPPLDAPHSIAHKMGDPSRGILFDNQHWFHDHQVEVTYETEQSWSGYQPEPAAAELPRTLAKLAAGEPLTIAVSGDSISFGLNASGLTGAPPHMPIYPQLVADQLQATFGSPITLVNRAIGGWRLENGLADLDALIDVQPDLVVIAYGMNHFGSRNAAQFRELQAQMLEKLHAQLPEAEVILVSPMHGNTDWVHTPAEQFEPHRAALASFAGPGVALADLTTLWGQMLERKRTVDLTGNGVNHPNDFGHRVYASAILGLLVDPAASATAAHTEFPEPLNTEKSSALPMPADQVAQTASLPEGFQLSVFASEPEVQNPIAIATDERGRLWVAENYTWAGNSLGNYRTDLSDRIIILEDTDGDGHHDKRTVFWDEGKKLTSIEVGYGGVWAIALPNLLYIPDRNRDDIPDGPPTVVLNGLNEDSVSHTPANGLRWGPDGWLYARHGILATSSIGSPEASESQRIKINTGIWRYHPTRGAVEAVMHGMTNSWGFDYDRYGEMFCINTVIGHLWHIIPGARTERMFGTDMNPHAYQLLPQVADHVHWDTGELWNQVREGLSDSTLAAGGGHAHIGLMIYQGDNWPDEYRDKVYTLNLHGRRINCDSLHREGASYVARHDKDLVLFADPFFRGMDMLTGPDGGVFIADWSDTGECHDHDGVHRTSGRIYKLTYGRPVPVTGIDLAEWPEGELMRAQSHPNAWWARQARRVLDERRVRDERRATATEPSVAGRAVHKAPRAASAKFSAPLVDLYRCWADPAGASSDVATMLASPADYMRAWGVRRAGESILPGGPRAANDILASLRTMAAEDPSGIVLLHIASVLQRLPDGDRWPIAGALAGRAEFAQDSHFPIMLWLGIEGAVPSEPAAALALWEQSQIPLLTRNIARRLTEEIERDIDPVEGLLRAARERPGWPARETVIGMAEALAGWSQAPAPESWASMGDFLKGDDSPQLSQAIDDLNVIFGDGQALDHLRALALDGTADPAARRQAIRSIAAVRTEGFDRSLLDLLGDRTLQADVLRALAQYDAADIPVRALASLGSYAPDARSELVRLLVSRPAYASVLLDAIRDGRIGVDEVSAFHARQIHSFGDAELSRRLAELWGDIRPTAADKRAQIGALGQLLAAEKIAAADSTEGRMLFNKVCSTCHVLYGEGHKIGPDLTGSNRQNLDYLLENIIDPSASVGNDFRTNLFVMDDGRLVSGVVTAETERTVTVQTPDGALTLDRELIESTKPTSTSLMPEALLQNLSEAEIQSLVAYLMSTIQVPLPASSQ